MRTNAGVRVCALAMLAALLGLTSAPEGVRAQDRSGVRPEVLSLPDGPGSIEGLGESFEPSASTGTSAYSVPLRVPPGVVGFEPSLALRYSSGAGNGELGLGWSLGLPLVQRGTDEGLPRYDADDRIVLRGMGGGAEDLVQLADGSWRFRIEGAFVRGRQRDDGSWEFRSRSGIRFRFGTTDESLARDPADPSRVFAWQLTEQLDTHGHVIRYEWERNAAGEPELARIVYNDFSPEVRNVVSFEREARPDVLTSYVATFPIRTERRIARIVVTHGGRLVRRYELGFSMMLGLSRLTSVRMVGNDGETALPTLSLTYVDFAPERAEVVVMEDAPARALGCAGGACEAAELDDVDGDALPDLLITDPALDGGRYSWVPNLDGQRWGSRRTLTSSPSVWLSAAGVQLADMDGDGAADVVARVSGASDGLRYYPASIDPTHAGEGFASAPVVVRPAMSFSLEDADVRLVDLDHDRRSDVLRIDPTTGEAFVAFNLGEGQFAALESVGRFEPSEVLSFSRSRLQLADMNGDGLTDLVALRDGSLRYWPSRGFGRFDAVVEVSSAPRLSEGETAGVQVRDLNGDGTADLVHVGVSRVRYWLSLAGSALLPEQSIDGTPELRPTTVVRVADMNGNGTADVVWIDPASSTPWRYLDVLADGTPGLLEAVENGLGRTTRIGYTSLGVMRGWAREQGIEWEHRSPIGQTVVHTVETETGLDPVVRFELWYASPHYDGAEREFRGFATSVRVDVGDEEQPTLVTETSFDVGEREEALKGMPLVSERRTEAGGIFDRDVSRYAVRTIATAASGEPIRYAFRDRLDRHVFELTDTPVLVRSEWDHDEHGNVTREAEWGIVEGDDVGAGDDERVTVRTFAADESTWMLDRIATERVEDEHGQRFAETRTYYDGPAFEGLPLGAVGAFGEVTRSEAWVEGERWVSEERYERDQHGNVVASLNATGGRREREYDPANHTLVRAERTYPNERVVLEWRAEQDAAFGVVTALTDMNGHQGRVHFDPLGRPFAIVAPGDTDELPSQTFEYRLGSPTSVIRYERRLRHGEGETVAELRHQDSAGRARGAFRQDERGQWATGGLVSYGARGWVRRTARPTFERSADLRDANDGRSSTHGFYDALGRVVRARDVDGSETRTEWLPLARREYDANDLDERSPHFDTPSTWHVDGLGRGVRAVQLDGDREVLTTYRRDPLGNLVEAIDAAGRSRHYAYDGRSHRTRIEDPNAGTWTQVYNDLGALLERTDGAGHRVRFEHDAAGRLLEEWHQLPGEPERLAARFHYDTPSSEHPDMRNTRGELAWVEDDAGAVFLGYDEQGHGVDRIRRFRDGEELATWADFDAMDRLVRRGFPDGTHLDLSYDARGLLDSVGGVIERIDWNAAEALERIDYANGVSDVHEYDARNELHRLTATSATTGEVLRDLTLVRDSAARITSVVDGRLGIDAAHDLSATYEFDDLYRLTRAESRVETTRRSYDDAGNITRVTSESSGTDVELRYGEDGAAPDQLTSRGDERFDYDDAGRVIRDGERSYAWDARGRLARVERGDLVEEYVYGYDGARTEKVTRRGDVETTTRYVDRDVEVRDELLTRYVFVGPHRAVQLDSRRPPSAGTLALRRFGTLGSFGAMGLAAVVMASRTGRRRRRLGALMASSTLLAALLVAACQGGGIGEPRNTSRPVEGWPASASLYVHDHLGSVVATADASGEVVSQAVREPYGVERLHEGEAQPFGFIGNELDATGLGDFGARPYRADLGRFLAVDPVPLLEPERAERPAHLQAYTYASGDPINFVDADGRMSLVVGGVVLAAVVVVAVVLIATTARPQPAIPRGPPSLPRWLDRRLARDAARMDAASGAARVWSQGVAQQASQAWHEATEDDGADTNPLGEGAEVDAVSVRPGHQIGASQDPYTRPGWRRGTRQKVYEQAKSCGGGQVHAPDGTTIEEGDDFDIGHFPEGFSELRDRAQAEHWTRGEFIDANHDLENLRPETQAGNRSHAWEPTPTPDFSELFGDGTGDGT
ncbi:MAG: SpvB/TcaC N-terminal domain-containing protein [Kofleriaceae bacterium]|nr:SpvB/TcaC N-terminal domain-containing protein [Kofleriaceae bacterium]